MKLKSFCNLQVCVYKLAFDLQDSLDDKVESRAKYVSYRALVSGIQSFLQSWTEPNLDEEVVNN